MQPTSVQPQTIQIVHAGGQTSTVQVTYTGFTYAFPHAVVLLYLQPQAAAVTYYVLSPNFLSDLRTDN